MMDPPDVRVSSRLYMKRQASAKQVEQESEPSSSTSSTNVNQCDSKDDGMSKGAKKMQRYREKLKEKGLYKEYRQKQTEIGRRSKARRSEEQKERDKELTRERVKRCREKKKELGLPLNKKPVKPSTRAGLEAERKKNRERKARYRASLTPQKKAAVNARQRQKAAERKRASSSMQDPPEMPVESSSVSCQPSREAYSKPNTKRKAVRKAKRNLPDSPDKFAEVVSAIVDTQSPRKREALNERGILTTSMRSISQVPVNVHKEVKEAVLNLRKTRRTDLLQQKVTFIKFFIKSQKGRPLSELRQELKVSWSYLKKVMNSLHSEDWPRKKRADSTPASLVESVDNFLSRGDISREEPSLRTVNAKTGVPTRFMGKTMKEAWIQYKAEHHASISFSKFCALRPKSTKTVAKDKWKSCCCEYCQNILLKKKSINAFLVASDHPDRCLGSKYDIANLTCCPPDPVTHMPFKKCIDRQCDHCGVHKLHEKMQPVLDCHSDSTTSWQAWKSVQQVVQGRQGVEKTSSRRMLVLEEGTFGDLIAKFEEDLKPFAWHLANYQWQQRQFAYLTQNLPDGWILMVMDYGENFTCAYQDEAQGAHWTRQQVTVHPIVSYYRCPDHPDDIVSETFFFVSDDLKHDSHGVQFFQQKATQLLLERGLAISKIIHFSDGCPSQYKGKTSFADASFAEEDIGIKTEKHFFGSRHGKGPCDREIGVVKRLARLAVLRRHCNISTAQELYDYGCASLTRPPDQTEHCHKRRCFHFVAQGTICRNRPERTQAKTVVGTRNLHCVRGHAPYLVSTRERSCFCAPCIAEEQGCQHADFCGEWTAVNMKTNRRRHSIDVPDSPGSIPEVNPQNPPAAVAPVPPASPTLDGPTSPTSNAQEDASDQEREEAEPAPDAAESTVGEWQVNSCIVVQYPDGSYPGYIREVVDDKSLRVEFLRPHNTKKDVFVFPDTTDSQIITPQMIVQRDVILVPSRNMREWHLQKH